MVVKSERLDSYLESHHTQDVKEKLAWLQALWIAPELLAQFHARIEGILDKNPGSENFISSEIWKLWLSMENTIANYKRIFWGLMMASANNPDWNPDESIIA